MGFLLENQVTEKLHMVIWNEHNNNDEICTLDSGDDVGFSFVSGIRHGLHFCAGPSRDSPFEIQKCFDKKSKRSVVFLREIGEWKRECAVVKIKILIIIIITRN